MAVDFKKDMKQMWDKRAKENAFYYIESEFWDGNIDKFFDLGKERTQILLDPVLKETGIDSKTSHILEIGCGVGRFSRAFSHLFRQVTAVDVSDEVVKKARELHPSTTYSNLIFQSTDGTSLDFIDSSSIDLVFSYEVFQHMPSPDVILSNLKEVGRVLKPQSIAYIHLMTDDGKLKKNLKMLLKQLIPQTVLKTLGFAPLTFDATWTGTSLSLQQIQEFCKMANLKFLKLVEDPTTGEDRLFLLATPKD